jgi:hypothetical protein
VILLHLLWQTAEVILSRLSNRWAGDATQVAGEGVGWHWLGAAADENPGLLAQDQSRALSDCKDRSWNLT